MHLLNTLPHGTCYTNVVCFYRDFKAIGFADFLFRFLYLQRKITDDLKEIQQDKHIFVKADKTTNHYKTEPRDYLTLVHKNVTKAYKKTNQNVPKVITSDDRKIAQELRLDDRIEVSANRDSFITMKDHKPDFINNPTCRLINPSKSEIGIISKHILDNMNTKVIHATQVNLWKSTSNVIEWFKAIPQKAQHAFITFDVCDFYPSISEQLLVKALDYASHLMKADITTSSHRTHNPPKHQQQTARGTAKGTSHGIILHGTPTSKPT